MIVPAAALCLALCPFVWAAPAPKKESACVPQKPAKTARLAFPDGKAITVDVVDTPKSREIGLMCRTKLRKDYGMLFAFPSESDLGFWMKNTLISLDIIWIGADKRITVVHEKMKKSRTDTPDREIATAGGRGQYVLELPAGAAKRHGLKAGDALKFEARVPSE